MSDRLTAEQVGELEGTDWPALLSQLLGNGHVLEHRMVVVRNFHADRNMDIPKTLGEAIAIRQEQHRMLVQLRPLTDHAPSLLATAKREAEQAEQITQLQNSAGFCEKHPPGNGHRRCLVCGCIELSFALSQIDYAIGEPNEMGVSTYDVFPYPDTVVDRVKNKVAEQAAEIERMRAALERIDGIAGEPHQHSNREVQIKNIESIARTALGKEPGSKPTIYPPKSLCICGHCYPAPAGSLCNPDKYYIKEPRP